MVYLNSPSKRITKIDKDRVAIDLEPGAIMRQRIKDEAGSYTEVEFTSALQTRSQGPPPLRIESFWYVPGEDPICRPGGSLHGVQSPVFSAGKSICVMEGFEDLPPGTCPAAEDQGYCIPRQLAEGEMHEYFSRRPEFATLPNDPFNQAALYTTWTASRQS